jgi:hypothetical protein
MQRINPAGPIDSRKAGEASSELGRKKPVPDDITGFDESPCGAARASTRACWTLDCFEHWYGMSLPVHQHTHRASLPRRAPQITSTRLYRKASFAPPQPSLPRLNLPYVVRVAAGRHPCQPVGAVAASPPETRRTELGRGTMPPFNPGLRAPGPKLPIIQHLTP